jgi:hypothetical protein
MSCFKPDKEMQYVFVAMPLSVEMEDICHYGIQRAVRASGFQCVRVDKIAFTGDILDQIKDSINSAVATVVELTTSNPNVHLELGYAWGRGIPTVLLVQDGEELCFDIRGQKCLNYCTIKDLEAKLTEELAQLKANGSM